LTLVTYIVQSVTNETTLVVDRIITSGTAQDYGVYGADHDGAALKTMLASDVQIDLYGGVDDDPIDTDIQGSEAEATGLHAFDRKEKVRLLIIPDAHLILDSEGASATADIHDYAMAYCEGRDELFYLYSSDYGKTPTTVQTHFDDMADDSKLAAFYWPWIRVSDPLAAGGTWVPTVGHQAGMFARVHSGDQPYKGLANEKLVGALELEYECSQAEQGPLNEKGINVVRIFDGAIRTMGARTISTDPEWIYIHKRLTYIMIWTSIKEALQGLLFSVNDERLWGKIIASVRAFARTLDRRYHPNGALRNPVDPEADPFYIVCDESLNPPESSTVYYKSGWCIVNCAEVIEEMSGLWDGGYSHTEL
jgi:phage tail sheath protein FI